MASLVPGYSYDIFISYRQKDNKYDGWVTEFVSNLKKELEATFKEDISIYFDENPHDGLHEHHDVDDSLKDKLKCLIFIPILSRTYCDPKSFAFEHEFKAFVRIATNDPKGLKLKLPGGNVASRVLPVRIHELDKEDVTAFEAVTGSVLRSIDFVFQSAGVNRPLLPADKKEETLHHVFYRDQVNKVANAIREIISGLKQTSQSGLDEPIASAPPKRAAKPGRWRTPALVSAFIVLAALASYFLLKPPALKPASESGLAVLPFTNNSGRADLDFLSVGMASEIRSRLSMSKQFNFISALQSTLPYLKAPKPPKEVGDDLGVDYILSGIYQADGNRIRVEAEFLDAATGRLVWSLPVEKELSGIFDMQGEIAAEVMKRFSAEYQLADEVGGTTNMEAYEAYTEGAKLLELDTIDSISDRALLQIRKSISLDSGFAKAWEKLLDIESYHHFSRIYDSARVARIKKYVVYVRSHFPNTGVSNIADAIYFYRITGDFDLALQSLQKVLDEDPDNLMATSLTSAIYKRKLEHTKSILWKSKEIQLSPHSGGAWGEVSTDLENMGDYSNALNASLKEWNEAKSVVSATDVLLAAAEAGYPIDNLPEDLLKKAGYWTDVWRAHLTSDWHSLLKVAKKEKNWYQVACAYRMLNQSDSAKYWANKELERNPGYWDMIALAMGREPAVKSIETSSEHFISSGQDRWEQCRKLERLVIIMVLAKDYPEATRLLKKLNDDFPEYQNFERYFRFGMYDGIKKEYPPFNEALKNLKRRPIPDVSQYISLD